MYLINRHRIEGRIKINGNGNSNIFYFLVNILKESLRVTGLEFSLSLQHQLYISIHFEKVFIFNSSGLIIVVIM